MLKDREIEKVTKQLKDFDYMPKLDMYDLAYYDPSIYKKVKDETLYTKVLDFTLSSINGPRFYSGENIIVYLSADKKHYVYKTYTWGD